MEEKVKILMELDKKTVQAAAYLANIDLSDEVWQKWLQNRFFSPWNLWKNKKRKWNWEWRWLL